MSLTHSERLRRMASEGENYDSFLASCANELDRLNLIINQPENDNFVKGMSIEAEHQLQRWPAEHDESKNGWDWFWTIGYLSQKAATAFEADNFDKAKHHCISTAALMKNLHAHVQRRENQRGSASTQTPKDH